MSKYDKYHNNDDDDTLIYDSSVEKPALWAAITKLAERVAELESQLAELKMSSRYFGEK